MGPRKPADRALELRILESRRKARWKRRRVPDPPAPTRWGHWLGGLGVETVLAFAEHIVVSATRLWNEYDPRRKRHLQRVLFPEGLAYDGESFGTPVTCLFFSDLEDFQGEKPRMVSPTGFEPVLPA